HTVGWPELRARIADFPPERVAAITGLAADDVVRLARLYATTPPALIKLADGLQRNRLGGQTVRAICALPALTGQYGVLGGGLAYSTSDYVKWDGRALAHWQDSPPLGRVVNMNRLGAALLGEASDPPIQSLFVFGSNPAAIAPNAGQVVAGLRRDDLFTVVHELFMTDTADYADIVLPATSQLEHADLHKAYGHTVLSYNAAAIAPLGEAKSNWDVMRLLAAEMGFTEPWLRQTADEVIDEVLLATAARNPALHGVTPARLRAEGSIPLHFSPEVPFADGRFPTPSGKVELRCENVARLGLDPVPDYLPDEDDGAGAAPLDPARFPPDAGLTLISAAAHHFVTSSFANRADMLQREGAPFVELHPADAAARGIADGEVVVVENGRGCCELLAKVTDAVRPGVAASPKGRWARLNDDGGQTVNWLTSDALADMAGQSTFHSNTVWVRKRENS
ncbi:MAG: molybdopterin-dependent oxidoreductase, partial [Anaerolineales bacterium]|nr:molybdopterin-dependent oxidoreductase [Anaerolineales bacterium]